MPVVAKAWDTVISGIGDSVSVCVSTQKKTVETMNTKVGTDVVHSSQRSRSQGYEKGHGRILHAK